MIVDVHAFNDDDDAILVQFIGYRSWQFPEAFFSKDPVSYTWASWSWLAGRGWRRRPM